MQGSSRPSYVTVQRALGEQLAGGADGRAVGEELFAVTDVLDSSASLRRALADPSGEAQAKRGLADRLFGGKVSDATAQITRTLAGERWAADRDLADSAAELAVEAVLRSADTNGRIDRVEDELFRVERTVAGNPGLRDAMLDSQRSGSDKAGLLRGLLEGKVADETLLLSTRAAAHPRGQRLERVLDGYVATAARLREQLTATVFTAHPLQDEHRDRLAAALGRIYQREVQINVIVDPAVVGGLRVQVGDEVIDGSVASRLEDARRLMTGS